MAKPLSLPPSEDECGHPSHDTSNRFEVDALLRRHGFEIWERRGEAVWVLKSRPSSQKLRPRIKFTQAEALQRIDPRIVADSLYLEDMDREAELNRLLDEGKGNEPSG